MLGSNQQREGVDRSGFIRAVLIFAILLSACGQDSRRQQTSARPVSKTSHELVSVLRSIGDTIDFERSTSPSELASRASLSVVGTITEVIDGRVFGIGPGRDDEPAFFNIGMTIAIDSVIGGDKTLINDGMVYLEIVRPKSLAIDDVRRATPNRQRVILFLDDYSEGLKPFQLIAESSAGKHANTLAPYADGFLLEDANSGTVIGGLSSLDESTPTWRQATSSIEAFVAKHFTTK